MPTDDDIATCVGSEMRLLAPDIVLVTYRTTRPDRSTLRSSVWRRRDGRWSLVFHQGTVAVRDQPWCG